MKQWKVEFVANLPEDITKEQVEEYMRFELGERGSMTNENPLVGRDLEADFMSVNVYLR